jgi:hypothetical protein
MGQWQRPKDWFKPKRRLTAKRVILTWEDKAGKKHRRTYKHGYSAHDSAMKLYQDRSIKNLVQTVEYIDPSKVKKVV